jgi:ATP-binding cassette subfamily C protein
LLNQAKVNGTPAFIELLRERHSMSDGQRVDALGTETGTTNAPLEVLIKDVDVYGSGGKKILQRITLEIAPGSKTALIGDSGAGKSTLFDVILGLRPIASGSVTINGIDSGEFIRRNPGVVAYVPQRPEIFRGTVLENILLTPGAANEVSPEIAEAVKSAGLESAVARLPDGYATQLSSDTALLSGGEIQRLGIARALLRKPRLLLLDEVTSALDSQTEQQITTTLNLLIGQVTIITIAHRLETIRDSDKVFKLSGGELIGEGTYEEVLDLNHQTKPDRA